MVKISTSNNTTDSIAFGVSGTSYGYIAPGADTVTPFSNSDIEIIRYATTNTNWPGSSYTITSNDVSKYKKIYARPYSVGYYGGLFGGSSYNGTAPEPKIITYDEDRGFNGYVVKIFEFDSFSANNTLSFTGSTGSGNGTYGIFLFGLTK